MFRRLTSCGCVESDEVGARVMKRDGHGDGAEICGSVEKGEGKAARLSLGEERGRQSRKVDAAPRGIQSSKRSRQKAS